MIIQYIMGFGAGFLSLLAPCVLPIIPIVFGSSLQNSKIGPIANALGLTFSFTLFGILTSLFNSIFSPSFIQNLGATLLIIIGFLFLFPKIKNRLMSNFSRFNKIGNHLQQKINTQGQLSEFLMGAILGMVWAPCSGPTLALAYSIATQTDQLLHASAIFFFFGLGAGIGLLGLGILLRRFTFLTTKIINNLRIVNITTGFISILIGTLLLADKMSTIEEYLLKISPPLFINISTWL